MPPLGNAILASSISSNAEKLKTPLKASVVILTTVILASCGSGSGFESYYTTSNSLGTPNPDGNTGATGGNTGATGGNTGATGGNTGATGGNTGATGGNTGATGGNTGATGGNTGTTGGNTGATGGNTGATGGNTGATGGNTGDDYDQIKAKLVKAQQEAAAQKAKAEVAQQEAADAKSQLVQAQDDLAAAEQALADALAGGGNTEALEKLVADKKLALEAANTKVTQTEQAAAAAQTAADAQLAASQEALQSAIEAQAAATIKNDPEAKKSGVQTLNVNVSPLNQVFKTTTRDFSADSSSVVARADIASNDLLGELTLTTSADNDTAVADSNGFKSHKDNAVVEALGQKLPLDYDSVYKDYGDDMRIGHIDGKAVFNGVELPVNGAAVIGNATKAANMPGEGTVGYTGDATHRKLGIGNAIEFGSSVFTADFVAKAVDGKLSFANAGNIDLKATIDGNQFSGVNGDYKTDGGFFGGDAQYLGGVYKGNDAQGTYGATSNKQTAAEQAAADAQALAQTAQQQVDAQKAKADAAKAEAQQAQAAAVKAQEALAKAEEALANAGSGGDGGLAAALERAETAEKAAEAAEEVVEKAQIAETAAITAKESAEKAKQVAEKAAIDAKNAADKAIGDAKAEADELVAQANAAAEQAKADAETAKANADQAAIDKEEAIKEKEAALSAKANAEAAAAEAQAKADAAEILANQFDEPDSAISGVQSTITEGDFKILDNYSVGYEKIILRTNELNSSLLSPIEVDLKSDKDTDLGSGFKKNIATVDVLAKNWANIPVIGKLNYTSVYKNFDDQMQIGHVYGQLKRGVSTDVISTTFVQGQATNISDLNKLAGGKETQEGKAQYNGVATLINSELEVNYEGTSKFDVDFVNKLIDGDLTFNGSKNITIAADINGNKFSGEVNGIDTSGGFFGKGAGYLGGVYAGNGVQGTYGAERDKPVTDPVDPTDPNTPVNPNVAPDTELTGFQSTTLSSKELTLPLNQGQLENAVGYVAIRDDKSDFTQTTTENGEIVPVDNRKGDNFTSFNNGVVRGDMVQPKSVIKPIEVNLRSSGEVTVDAGKGGFNPTYKYSSVYENFDQQMQVGHVYGNFDSIAGEVSRATNVYVQGYATNQADIDYLKQVNDGKASYSGNATYIENIHLADNANTAPVKGTSNFDVDFVNNSVKGQLEFAAGTYKYMPTGNKIAIDADITGNTFASNKNGIDTAGGFYGEDAKFLGGIYQDAAIPGGKGDVAGTGTKFQGTFGADKK